MKKKTRSKSRNNFPALFFFAIFMCIVGASINSYLFYNNFFRALTKLNEKPIATITFKYKTAQRKFLERVVWDRLRQGSPVYNGDTIHTANLSEATVWFSDGNVMELAENTMAQVFLTEDKSLTAELLDGYATVDASESSGGMTLSSNGVRVSLETGSSLSASSDAGESGNENGFSLQVIKGNASIKTEGNEALNVTEGEAVELSSVDGDFSSQKPKTPLLVVNEPLQNSKVLYHEKGSVKVPFRFYARDIPENASDAVLFMAGDKNFSDIKEEINIKLLRTAGSDEDVFSALSDVELENGTYYWRISLMENGSPLYSTQTGRIQVIQSPKPNLVAPVQGYSYSFRNRLPSVRLIWTESPFATSYNLEIADNPGMQNPVLVQRSSLTSSIVSTLGEGKYWWRVTPFYTINKKGLASPSETGSFLIEKKGTLEKPILFTPVNNGILNVEQNAKEIAFSWKQENEASKYILTIADNPELKNPKIVETSFENFCSFKGYAKNLTEGKWYWAVSQEDGEGNVSPSSDVRFFFALKGNPEQHTIEPADGYRSSITLLPDTKFTWKKNLPENFESFLEISSAENFSNIIYSTGASASGMKGVNLQEGEYWWRLRSQDSSTGTVLSTPPKKLNVMGNLPASTLEEPKAKAVARESVPYKFKWSEVPEADYYRIQIFRKSDDFLVHEDVIYGTETEVEMFRNTDFIDRTMYRWNVQANSNAIPGIASRRTGKISENDFYLAKLRPVEIDRPVNYAKIKGTDAILSPVVARWSSVDDLKKAQFVLRKTDSRRVQEIMRIPSDKEMAKGKRLAPNRIVLDTPDGLRPGRYEIIVYAETIDGIDVSNSEKKNIGHFSVLPVEPLSDAQNLSVFPEVFNADYLRNPENPRTITLSWASVPDATDYFVSIKNRFGSEVLSHNVKEGLSYSIDFTKIPDKEKSSFSNGTFTWTVRGVRRVDTDKDGNLDKILQEGKEVSSVFTTDIPTPKKTKATGAANPYGK